MLKPVSCLYLYFGNNSYYIPNRQLQKESSFQAAFKQVDSARRFSCINAKAALTELLLRLVEPKGFEPLSSCVINYAFYMLIFQLIVGIWRAGNRPNRSP